MAYKSILVVGGGMSGITAAVEAAEAGYEVFLVEKLPYLGGRVAQLNEYFPKLCPPSCGLEINFRRLKQNSRIHHFTLAEVENIEGQEGDYSVAIKFRPRYVNEKCTACGKCVEACPVERPNDFNFGLNTTKAIYLPHEFAFPFRYVIDGEYCQKNDCGKCVSACPYGAIELDMQPRSVTLKVGAVIWATGWQPYDASKISYYGFGRIKNVISNMMLERLAAVNGPTAGRIVRLSDQQPVKRVAFVQCAGSRDENHLPYCSQVCCLASLKQATYVRSQYPDAEVYIFYIDIRALGKYEDFYNRVKEDEKIVLVKGKVGEISEDPTTGEVILQVEDQINGKLMREKFDLVVLATGIVPNTAQAKVPYPAVAYDEDGFLAFEQQGGIIGAGCVKKPLDVASSVQDATAAALKAIQFTVRR